MNDLSWMLCPGTLQTNCDFSGQHLVNTSVTMASKTQVRHPTGPNNPSNTAGGAEAFLKTAFQAGISLSAPALSSKETRRLASVAIALQASMRVIETALPMVEGGVKAAQLIWHKLQVGAPCIPDLVS
jgi:hypothetical protein